MSHSYGLVALYRGLAVTPEAGSLPDIPVAYIRPATSDGWHWSMVLGKLKGVKFVNINIRIQYQKFGRFTSWRLSYRNTELSQ